MRVFGDLRLVDVAFCGGVVILFIAILGMFCWSADQAVTHGHPGISHSGRSRRRACQRDKIG